MKPTGSGSEGITIWYRVDSEGCYAQQLKNFTGESTASLREAMAVKSELTYPAAKLNLVVAGSGRAEIDLEDLQSDWRMRGISFSFAKLISDYDINYDSPILVRLPRK